MAQGIFQAIIEGDGRGRNIFVDSAGTRVSMPGRAPDPRARTAVELHCGVKIDRVRARAVMQEDFQRFDYLIAVDSDNFWHMESMCPESCTNKLSLLLSHDPQASVYDLPDPYYGSITGFENLILMMEPALEGLSTSICSGLEKNS